MEEEAEFDAIAHQYLDLQAKNVSGSGFPPSYFDEYKVREIAGFLKDRGLRGRPLNILNFGCGVGQSERFIRQHIPEATAYGTDVSRKSIDIAQRENKDQGNVHFQPFDGRRIPFDIPFDVILVANVFHHIPRERHASVLAEIRRSLAPKGLLFLFEHNPFNPVTVRTVKSCPFDKGVVLLSPVYTHRLFRRASFGWHTIRFTLFFPKFLSFFIPFERYLRKVPMGAQYYVVAQKEK